MSKDNEAVLTAEEIDELEDLESTSVRKTMGVVNVDPRRLAKDTSVNTETLDTAMMRQASLYAYYAVIAARTAERADNFKTARDVLESKIARELRNEATASKTKITEKQIEGDIRIDSRWIRAAKAVNKARADAELAKQALFALSQKRDMMVQIGVSIREEMKGTMRIKEAEAHETAGMDKRERALNIAKG